MKGLHMENLYVATKNPHKVEEFRALLSASGFTVMPLPAGVPESPESGSTFEANVMEKASFYSRFCDGWVLADDSGICVDALHGAPGVHSARYAGPGGTDAMLRAKLLTALKDVQKPQRTATMVSVVALWHQHCSTGLVSKGTVHGLVLEKEQGSGGFGYDPLFYVSELGKTMGQMTADEKNAVSHRSRAVAELQKAWIRLGLVAPHA